jgi:hypothetical protein
MDTIINEIAAEISRTVHPIKADETWATRVFLPKQPIENCYNLVFRTSIGQQSLLYRKGKGNRPVTSGFGKQFNTRTTYNGQPVWFRLIQEREVSDPKAVQEQHVLFNKIADTIIQLFQQHAAFCPVTE